MQKNKAILNDIDGAYRPLTNIAIPSQHNQLQGSTVSMRILLTVNHIQTSYSDTISLDDLASIASMSRYHFNRSFSKVVGVSPIKYLNCLRIQQAKELLNQTNWSIIHIAFEVGYNQSAHFTNQFKQETGMTPSHYRKIATHQAEGKIHPEYY